jgi:hypothetical protein
MLLQAREAFWRELQGEKARCPFCEADKAQSVMDFKKADVINGLCWKCPLINILGVDKLHYLMENCEDMGRHALQVYEETGQ